MPASWPVLIVLMMMSSMLLLTLRHFSGSFLKAFWKNSYWLITRSSALFVTFELCF